MAENHELNDFDVFLKSIGASPEGAEEDVSVDELLAQLRTEFPADFGGKTDGQAAPKESAPSEGAPAEAAPAAPAPSRKAEKTHRAPKKQKEAPPRRPEKRPEEASPAKGGGFLDMISRHHRGINLALIILALILTAGIVGVIFVQSNSDPYGEKIVENVHVAGVDVGGMSKQEAIDAVSSAAGGIYEGSDMTVVLGSKEIILAAAQTQPKLNVAQAVENAYAYSRSGSTAQRQREYRQAQQSAVDIPLENSLTLNADYIRSTISDYLGSISSSYVPSGYALEGSRPGLDADSFDESVPCQNLVLTVGSPGSSYDMDGIMSAIADAYSQRNFRVVIPEEYLPEQPEALDIDAIYSELHVDAVEAVEGSGDSEGTPGSCGYTFSLEDARRQLSSAGYGDVITIPMEYIIPEKLDSNGSFLYPLASVSTPVSSNADYNENMLLLCQQLNGKTLASGESFSFDAVLPKRTEENGFRNAPAHGDECLEEAIGGGADQVATTLYVAAMTSGMQLTEHHIASHAYSFATRGTEITVSNSMDLKFRNTLDCAVMIRAKVTESRVIIRFLSEKEADFEIKLEVSQLSSVQPKTVNVQKNASDGYTAQQVLTEGIEGGQFALSWVTYKKGTDTEIRRTGEHVSLPALNKGIVNLIN